MNLTVKNVSKRYGDSVALQDCSLTVQQGTFTAIIGPNGSGKSTLLRVASLLEEPDRGEVIYTDGARRLEAGIALRRRIAVVLSGNTLFNDSVFSNIAYGLRIRGYKRRIISDRVHEILGRFKLSDRARRNVRTLSTGEAQRVVVARTLVTEPEYLFLDEPTASLDPLNTELIEAILREYSSRNGMSIVMITHNMFQAKRLAERVLFMYRGRVIEDAESNRFFTSPQDELARRFISGEMVW
jgi:tungstate transport system ATP-binding protein